MARPGDENRPSLRRNWFHILTALARRDAHGSAIVRDVLAQTEGSIQLWPATLYRTLDEMVEAGFLQELSGRRHPKGVTARRRYYRTSAAGRRALLDEADRMSQWAKTARKRLKRKS